MKIFFTAKIIIFVLSVFLFGYFLASYFANREIQEAALISNESGKVLGEEEAVSETNISGSDNFRMPEISFGGGYVLPSGEQSLDPEIKDLRSDLVTAKNKQDMKFLISWKTNKPCLSSIEYSKDGSDEPKSISEQGYGYIHSAYITPLNYSTTYSYAIVAKDRWGNEIKSDKLVFYTGAPSVSIFDLLGGAFKQMFGWANR